MTAEINTEKALQVGELLRVAREKHGVSSKELATSLNLPERFILYLESGEFDKLPGNTFVRGYIRNYVKYLNLENGQEIIGLFEQQVEPDTIKEGKSLDFKQIKRLKSVSNSIYWLVSFVVCLVLAGVLFLIWQHYVSSKTDDQNTVTASTTTNVVADQNTVLNTNSTQTIIPLTNLDTNANTVNIPLDNAAETQDSNDDNEVDSEDSAQTQEPEPSVTVKKGEGRIKASFSANCWVSVKDAVGKELVQGVFSPKRNLDITGKAPLEVMFGAPSVVSLTYNGKSIKIEAKPNSSHRIKLGN